jgi:hypothetical protein
MRNSMPPCVEISKVIDYLLKHPALKSQDETYASVNETYMVAFEFFQPGNNDVFRHEQEFGTSYRNDEMEMRRKSWVRMNNESGRTSPLILSVLDFEKYVTICSPDNVTNRS